MKRSFLINGSLLAGLLILVLVFTYGCGATSGTDSAQVDAEYVTMGKASASFATSGSGLSQTAGQAGTMASATQKLAVNGSATLETGPPDSFFTTNILADATDGYVIVEGMHSDETVKIRMKNANGTVIDASYLAGKQVADISGYNWQSLFSGTGPTQAQVTSFMTNPTYQNVSTLGMYMARRVAAVYIHSSLVNPAYDASEAIGGMQGVVTFTGNSHSGSMSMDITTDADGKPTGSTGSGTITMGGLTMTVTMTMTFSNGEPSTMTMTGENGNGYTMAGSFNADGSGTVTIKNASGEVEATVTVNADGSGTVTDDDGNSENFTL